MAFENYTIREFISAWFACKRDVMDDEEFDTVYTEYVDTSGLFQSDDFDKMSYIQFLGGRINSIKIAIRLQREFITEFGQPYIENFEFFKMKGHRLKWNKDIEDFIKQLNSVELKESKNIAQLEKCIVELKKIRDTKGETVSVTRGSFITTINSLGKIGFKIDNDKTTVEELAYMIKQQFEENSKP